MYTPHISVSKMKLYCVLLLGLACWIQISSSNALKQRKIASILGEDDQNTLQTNKTVENQVIRWDNKGDLPLSVQCDTNNGEAMYRVRSTYIGWRRDRRWKWDCRKVADKAMTDCSWTNYINNWGTPINKKCPRNHVLTGVKSVHYNAREDRRWKMKCCRAPGYVTTNCQKTQKLNKFGTRIEHKTINKGALVGLYTIHHLRHRDREWQLYECKYTEKKQQPSPPPQTNVKTRHYYFVPYDMLANLNPWG